MGGCRGGEVRAGTTSLIPDHKGFKLEELSEIHPLQQPGSLSVKLDQDTQTTPHQADSNKEDLQLNRHRSLFKYNAWKKNYRTLSLLNALHC